MRKLWQSGLLALGGLVLLVLTYLGFMSLALHTLGAKYDGLTAGLTVEQTDRLMGGFFSAQTIQWNDIPEIYTGHYVEKPGSVVHEYRFLGMRALNIVAIYDAEGHLYLYIPCYE